MSGNGDNESRSAAAWRSFCFEVETQKGRRLTRRPGRHTQRPAETRVVIVATSCRVRVLKRGEERAKEAEGTAGARDLCESLLCLIAAQSCQAYNIQRPRRGAATRTLGPRKAAKRRNQGLSVSARKGLVSEGGKQVHAE